MKRVDYVRIVTTYKPAIFFDAWARYFLPVLASDIKRFFTILDIDCGFYSDDNDDITYGDDGNQRIKVIDKKYRKRFHRGLDGQSINLYLKDLTQSNAIKNIASVLSEENYIWYYQHTLEDIALAEYLAGQKAMLPVKPGDSLYVVYCDMKTNSERSMKSIEKLLPLFERYRYIDGSENPNYAKAMKDMPMVCSSLLKLLGLPQDDGLERLIYDHGGLRIKHR